MSGRYLVALFLALCVGCSGRPEPDLCAQIECDRGVCRDGQCRNTSSCVSEQQCLPGFVCFDEACLAAVPCADDAPCARGVCVDGACVNAEVCSGPDECIDGWRCNPASQCVEDPCAQVDCVRGVCNPESLSCVNSGVCTAQTQGRDCLDGYFCYGQNCELPDAICDDVDCERGVCDPAAGACVEGDPCAADVECLPGSYCGDDGTCRANQCDAQMRVCARGVCDPVDGRCTNSASCAAHEECVDGFSCVQGDCLRTGEECGDCPGTRVCVYDPDATDAQCVEGDICFAALDCDPGRYCEGQQCGPGTPCAADTLEPNDDAASATVLTGTDSFAAGSICAGDLDVFTFDTASSPLFRGVLVVDLAVAASDVGGGALALEVDHPDGTTVGRVVTDAAGIARLTLDVGVLDLGTYEVRVGEDAVGVPGLRYGLYVNLLEESTVDACAMPIPLGTDTLSGNTGSGNSYLLSLPCTQPNNQSGENLYAFTLTEASWVRIVAEPEAAVDVAVSLQRRCEAPSSLACENNAASGLSEVIATDAPPGDYYVVVEGSSTNSGGGYTLSLTAQPIVCARSDASCVADVSRFCNGQGTGFEEVACEEGCDAATGRCQRSPRDVCFTALDASNGLLDQVNYNDLANDYDPGPSGCVPYNFGNQTGGPDAAYFVDLQPNQVLHVVQQVGGGDRGSLYLVTDCENLDSCVLGVNASSTGVLEELVYFNTTPDPQPLYLIADTEVDAFGFATTANISIDVLDTVCTPGELRCAGPDVSELCLPLGTGWLPSFCSFGCITGPCEPIPNNQCSGAIDLVANGPFTGRIDEFSGNYNPGFSSCTQRSTSGPDAMFSVTPAAGEVALVNVTANFDVGLYALTDCNDAFGSCVDGSDGVGQMAETIEFVGDGATTFYVGVDSQFGGTGAFTVEATLQMPTCTPGAALQCLGPQTLQYCTPLGIEAPYTCATTCTNAMCDQPSGQICPDPIVLGDGDSYTGTIDTANTIDPGVGQSGACNFPSDAQPYGSDVIFAVDLVAGDWLFAEYDMNSSFAIMYLLADCNDTDSCLERSLEGQQGQVVHEATTDQRVFLVVDRTTTSISNLVYTLDVDVRRQDCAPGAPAFCSDVDTVQYCDSTGFSRDYVCNGTCTAGRCDTPTGDECIDPIVVQPNEVVTGDWSTGTNSIQLVGPLAGWCEIDDTTMPTGPEDVYRIDLLPGDLLRASLETLYGSAYHYILEDCFDHDSCVANNFDRGPGVIEHYSQFGGPVFVVVDASSTFNSTSPYELTFQVSSGGICAPNQSTCAAGGLSVCDDSGTSFAVNNACAAGCASEQACAVAPGADLCATAPTTGSTTVYGNFATLTNDVSISSGGCTGSSGFGTDVVYAVNAGPGEVIRATVKSYGLEAVQIYIATDCTNPDGTCVEGARGDLTNFAEVVVAPPTFGTYYVIAEATSNLSDEPFELTIEVLTPECTPFDYECAPAAQSMLVCSEHGLWEPYLCSGGCSDDACGTPIGQACFDAIPLGDGDFAMGTFDVPSDINPGPGQVGGCNFGAQQASGADTVYSIDLLAGDILDIDYTSNSSWGIVYLLSDCNVAASCLANTSEGLFGNLRYTAPIDQTVFLVMDRTTPAPTAIDYTLDVEILRPNCTPGDPQTCADATTLQYCDALGFSRTYACGGAAGTCTNGACDTPTAEICEDAGILTDGVHVTGDFNGTDDFSPPEGTHGACVFPAGDAADGVDHMYRVDLSAGDWFIANYVTAATTALAYLVETCGDISTCRAVTSEAAQGQLAYQATVDETLYFVMDRTTSGPAALSWDLDVTIGPSTCTPGVTQCSDATTLQWCNAFGLFETWPCTTTCSAGRCDAPSSDICADAITLTDGAMVMDDFGGTDDLDLGEGTVGTCSFGLDDQPGTDHFYRVDLTAGETATVDFMSTSAYAIAYFTSDCFDTDVCLANSNLGSSGTVSYTATTNETVFLVFDRNLTGSTPSLGYDFTLTIN